jgi:hypothetical protein
MRKRLDLQVKNKRTLMLQIKALKERQTGAPAPAAPESRPETVAEEPDASLAPAAISDRVHQLRQRVRSAFPGFADIAVALDDIAHLVDQDRLPGRATRELLPSLFRVLPPNHSGRTRPIEWVLSAPNFFYAKRLAALSNRLQAFQFSENRQHFSLSIFEQFLASGGNGDALRPD